MNRKIDIKRLKLLQIELRQRMVTLGHSDLMGFYKASGLKEHMSFESYRRCLNDPDRTVSVLTVALVMNRLGYSNPEIRETMRELGDNYYYVLVSDVASSLTLWEEGLTAACKKMVDAHPGYERLIAESLATLAAARDIDISRELAMMIPTRQIAAQKIALMSSTIAEKKPEITRKLQLD